MREEEGVCALFSVFWGGYNVVWSLWRGMFTQLDVWYLNGEW